MPQPPGLQTAMMKCPFGVFHIVLLWSRVMHMGMMKFAYHNLCFLVYHPLLLLPVFALSLVADDLQVMLHINLGLLSGCVYFRLQPASYRARGTHERLISSI
jgi:hypothetical protein